MDKALLRQEPRHQRNQGIRKGTGDKKESVATFKNMIKLILDD